MGLPEPERRGGTRQTAGDQLALRANGSRQQGKSCRRQRRLISRIAGSSCQTEGKSCQWEHNRHRWQEEGREGNVSRLHFCYPPPLFFFFRVTIFFPCSQKPSKWGLPNKGVQSRAARDLEQEVLDRRTVESARSILERKAKLYEKLKKGRSGGLSEAQFDGLLVDVSSPRVFLPVARM